MAGQPESKARQTIDRLLEACGWTVQDRGQIDLTASRGVAIREFPLRGGGEADYLLYADEKVIGIVEAEKEGDTLTGVEAQTDKYSKGLADNIPAYHRPIPFLYQTTGVETRFTNLLDPAPRSREIFAFHTPETLIEWAARDSQLRQRLRTMPPLVRGDLWDVQVRAIEAKNIRCAGSELGAIGTRISNKCVTGRQ